MQAYGLPWSYYVDNLRVFRFMQDRDSVWRNHVLHTDDVDPQRRLVMRTLGVNVVYALSPPVGDTLCQPLCPAQTIHVTPKGAGTLSQRRILSPRDQSSQRLPAQLAVQARHCRAQCGTP